MLGEALTDGVTPVEAKEIVYQALPYAGMARVFDFPHATNEVLTARGVELPLGQSTTGPDTRRADGLAVQKHIVGEKTVDAMSFSESIHLVGGLTTGNFGRGQRVSAPAPRHVIRNIR
ncbi:hypothetical protein, partial [Streptomyces alboverticillatus]|uniref:hypothetical protein n=1 Tax=Streptomyces alboverticillatus TaxID=173770 RepID=UPI001C4F3F58